MSATEYRSHFSLWALLAAPLIAGNDLRSMNEETHDILTNKEVIAVDQDALGIQGRRVKKDGDSEIWSKQMSDGSRAVILLNLGSTGTTIAVKWTDIGYPERKVALTQPPSPATAL
jgi:alpha-galactosidase